MKKYLKFFGYVGIVLLVLFLLIVALCIWAGLNPVTDCDSCLNGTTP